MGETEKGVRKRVRKRGQIFDGDETPPYRNNGITQIDNPSPLPVS